MKIAYLIQAHKNLEQLKGLIAYLIDGRHYCFVHIDKKSAALYKQLSSVYADNKSVFIVNDRVVVNWSGFSQVMATLMLMDSARQASVDFDRIHLMSGEDFPIQTLEYIDDFFEKNRYNEFIEYSSIGEYEWRLLQYNFLTESNKNRTLPVRAIQKTLREIQKIIPSRKVLENFELYKGSSWFNLSREALEYIMIFLENNPNFINQFNYSACADEHFFQIILLNSPFKEQVINDNLYYMEWSLDQNSPKYLDIQNLEQIKSKSDKLFARKFDEGTTKKLILGNNQ